MNSVITAETRVCKFTSLICARPCLIYLTLVIADLIKVRPGVFR